MGRGACSVLGRISALLWSPLGMADMEAVEMEKEPPASEWEAEADVNDGAGAWGKCPEER